MKIETRHRCILLFVLAASLATAQAVLAAKKVPEPTPSPSASQSAAPLPTATPEPADVAIPRLEAKLKADPNDRDSLQQLAGYYLAIGKPDQAYALAQRLLSLGVKTAQVYYLDGLANQTLGKTRDAIGDLENASNLEPTNAQILLTLTNLYLELNRPADAERVAKRATTFNATDKHAFENYGLVLGQEEKYDEARAQFEQAAKLDPKDAEPIVLEARSYVSQHALALAAQDFDRALALDPKDPEALLGKASLEANGHQVKEAIATFEMLLAAVPTDGAKAGVLIQESSVYLDEKMNGDAVAVLDRCQAQYPLVPACRIAKGDYDLAVAKDRNGAENQWKAALGSGRDNAEALQRLGQLSFSENKPTDAIGYFKRLVEVTPGDPRAYLTLAEIQGRSKLYRDAAENFRKAFALQRTPQALAGLGTVDLQMKNYKECDSVFTAIYRGAPGLYKEQPQLLYAYGKCAQGDNNPTAARAAFLAFKPFVKPGSPLAGEVNAALRSLAPAPRSTQKPNH